MLMALIYMLTICVVGAVLFWVIDKYVNDGRLNFAAGAPFAWSKRDTLAIIHRAPSHHPSQRLSLEHNGKRWI
jgi:hypothetical protein